MSCSVDGTPCTYIVAVSAAKRLLHHRCVLRIVQISTTTSSAQTTLWSRTICAARAWLCGRRIGGLADSLSCVGCARPRKHGQHGARAVEVCVGVRALCRAQLLTFVLPALLCSRLCEEYGARVAAYSIPGPDAIAEVRAM